MHSKIINDNYNIIQQLSQITRSGTSLVAVLVMDVSELEPGGWWSTGWDKMNDGCIPSTAPNHLPLWLEDVYSSKFPSTP